MVKSVTNSSLVSDIYIGDDGNLHKVIGGADTVLPFKKSADSVKLIFNAKRHSSSGSGVYLTMKSLDSEYLSLSNNVYTIKKKFTCIRYAILSGGTGYLWFMLNGAENPLYRGSQFDIITFNEGDTFYLKGASHNDGTTTTQDIYFYI